MDGLLVADGVAGMRASVAAAESGRGDGAALVVSAGTAVAGPDDALAVVAVGRVGAGLPAALVPRAAQPAVKMTAASVAANANARAGRGRLLFPGFPCLACPPNRTLSSICLSAQYRRRAVVRPITVFLVDFPLSGASRGVS
jgi:hypothetical protein